MTPDRRSPSSEVAVKFGRNLSRCRKRAGLSQAKVAARASLHRNEVSMLERGLRLPRVDTMMQLAAALSVSPMDLTKGIEWYPGQGSRGGFVIRDAP
ncbi:MAG: helix-turn-helix domain-containing protein [Solirubrobacterales bacterium]